MNARRLVIALTTLVLALGGPALANEIYKWTDDEGNVHYGDRPSGEPTEERVFISYKRTDGAAVQARVAARRENDEIRREARADEARSEEEIRAEREDRKKKCDDYRAKLETLVTSRRLYREDENGERVYLEDNEREDARQRAEELVAEYCGS